MAEDVISHVICGADDKSRSVENHSRRKQFTWYVDGRWFCTMDGDNDFIRKFSLDSLGYCPNGGGPVAKNKDSKMRRFSEVINSRGLDEAHFENIDKNLFRTSSTRTTTTTEKGSDYADTVTSRNSFKNHKKSFHKHFPAISETESLINGMPSLSLHPSISPCSRFVPAVRTNLARTATCSSLGGSSREVEIDLSEIQFIKKKNTARVVPTAISIITKSGEKYVFGSLLNRDACFKFLQTICPQLKVISANGSPIISSAENFHELEADMISSYSSQEDSADSQRVPVLERDKKRGRNVLHPSSSSKSSHAQTRSGSTTQSNTNREENTAVSWVTVVIEKIKSLLSTSSTTNVNKVLVIYLILAMLLLLSSGYIGLRIAALEKQLNTLGENPEFSLQKEYGEM